MDGSAARHGESFEVAAFRCWLGDPVHHAKAVHAPIWHVCTHDMSCLLSCV